MNQENETLEFFGPLLADPSKIKREVVHRRKQFDEKSIVAEETPAYEADGWQVDKRLKRSIRVKRPKAIDERLENRFWMLLARLGYPEINSGRKFTMLIDRKGAEPLRKQVDVFAKDDETVRQSANSRGGAETLGCSEEGWEVVTVEEEHFP